MCCLSEKGHSIQWWQANDTSEHNNTLVRAENHSAGRVACSKPHPFVLTLLPSFPEMLFYNMGTTASVRCLHRQWSSQSTELWHVPIDDFLHVFFEKKNKQANLKNIMYHTIWQWKGNPGPVYSKWTFKCIQVFHLPTIRCEGEKSALPVKPSWKEGFCLKTCWSIGEKS